MGNDNHAANGTSSNSPKANSISGKDVNEISNVTNLPAGFNYVGNPPFTNDEIKDKYEANNISGIIAGSEGLYKDSNNSTYYIDVIQLENKEAANNFISVYKSSFKPLNEGSRFTNDSFNGHSAEMITDYARYNGTDVPRYIYVWNNENYVLVVSGDTSDNSQIRQLAEATGY
jgi:hypothetical protein